jgi:hypothetical protein
VQGRGTLTWAHLMAALCFAVVAAFSLTAVANHSQTDLVSVGPSGGNGAFEAQHVGGTPDGLRSYFVTQESLVSGDTDASKDVYERSGGATALISTGPINGNGPHEARFGGVSADGTRVFFETTESLTSTDTDSARDVYERAGGTTTHVSIGPSGGNSGVDSFYVGNSTDGTRVFFVSYDSLVAGDTDVGRKDVYERSGGTVTQLSTGGNGPYGADWDGATLDGTHVFFRTQEQLVAADLDSSIDVYERSGGTVAQVSTGPINGNGAFDPLFKAVSQDGSRVFFETNEQLTTSDTDSYRDVYERSGGATTKLSLGPSGGNGSFDAKYGGSSMDGSRVWIETREPLVSGDIDAGCEDEFGNFVLPCIDLYERSGGTTSWVSVGGNGSHEASFAAASQNGGHVFFHTTESLVAGDTDPPIQDVYDRSGGNTILVSTSPSGGNGPHYAVLDGISKDGARVFFHTYESMVGADTDVWNDVYERYGGATTLISTGPSSTSGNNIAFYASNSDDGTKVYFFTDESLTSGDTDGRIDIYANNQALSPGYARPKGASPATFALVPAYQECTTPNNAHGAPLSYGSCGPPTQESGVLTVGTPDANLRPAGSISSVKLRAVVGASGPPDDSNVQVSITVRDALCRATNAACAGGPLSEYTGQVLVSLGLRLTDRYNGSPPVESATVQNLDIKVPVQCVATPAATQEGGLCQAVATVNSLYPGAVLDGRRAVWEVRDIRVLDAGPDGTGYGAGCPPTCGDGDETVFMRPGLFTP